jgi:hypothetical protein
MKSVMKFTQESYFDVLAIIAKYHFVKKRIEELKKLGFKVLESNVHRGGIGHIDKYKRKWRVQIGTGNLIRCNKSGNLYFWYKYAKVVEFEPPTENQLLK